MSAKISNFSKGFLTAIPVSLAVCWSIGSILTRGRRTCVEAASPPAQDIQLETSDGISIAATFRSGRCSYSPAVLLLHGVGASRHATAANAVWLTSLGYATLTIDFRGHGQSTTTSRTFGLREAIDARVAFAWLKQRQNNARICIIGISLGGAACLLGDTGPIPADALILQGLYSDIQHAIRNRIARYTSCSIAYFLEPLLSFQAPLRFGVWPSHLSPVKALPRYHGPVLIIGGEQDKSTLAVETRAIYAAARGNKKLMLFPTGDHTAICRLTSTVYRDGVQAFLAQTIGSDDIAK